MEDSIEAEAVSLGNAIQDTLSNVVQQIVDYSPEVIGASLILLLGWIIAKALSLSTHKVIRSFDSLISRFWRSDTKQHDKIRDTWAKALSKTVFWIVMIFFMAVASNVLGWSLFSGWMEQVFSYLPGIITGVVIILGGLILGNFSRSAVIGSGEKGKLQQRVFIAKLIQISIIFCAILIGVDQIGLNIDFLSNIVVTVIGILLAGAALAFGLGAKDMVANVIGSRYFQRQCKPGDIVQIGVVQGEVLEITQSNIVVMTDEGKAIVPAAVFHKQVTYISSDRQ